MLELVGLGLSGYANLANAGHTRLTGSNSDINIADESHSKGGMTVYSEILIVAGAGAFSHEVKYNKF